MNEIRKVVAYRAPDGQLFATEEDARRYDVYLRFAAFYKTNRPSDLPFDELFDWLLENVDSICNYLLQMKELK